MRKRKRILRQHVTFVCAVEHVRQLEALAQRESRSRSNLIELLVADFLSRAEKRGEAAA